jgi:UDP-2,3-diacylglucosamine pyrophosphatase LpxH
MREIYNTLVISDLHLGEDLSLSATEATSRNLGVLERQLIEFLRYHTNRRHDGVPWRLVINGDMVDFLAVSILPGDGRLDEVQKEVIPTEDEMMHGLGRRSGVACAKMRAVVERHEDVFRAMARFLAAGNRVEIICGNHDVEMHWPSVQRTFKHGVAAIWRQTTSAHRPNAPRARDIESRIDFHPWFFYEKGVSWIEHGHQYDECCSFDFALDPLAYDGEHIANNVDAASMRYVANQLQDAEPHAAAEWSMGGWLRFALNVGVKGAWQAGRGYVRFVGSMLSTWRAHAQPSKMNRERRRAQRERLEALAKRHQIAPKALRAIDDLHRRPVVTSLRRLMSVLMVDRLLVNVAALLMVLVALFVMPLVWALPIALATFGLAKVTGGYLHRRRLVNPEVTLALAPERIRRYIDAPYVCFGHTHEPVEQPLDKGGCYLNSGTWLPTGKPGLLRSFTHVVIIQGERGPSANLRQWRDGASRAFTPGWAPHRSADAVVVPTAEGETEPVRVHAA